MRLRFAAAAAALSLLSPAFASRVHAAEENEGQGHPAAHGGCLNAIEACSIGHAEALVEEGALKVWFVGGDGATTASVRLAASAIPLLVSTDGGLAARLLVLEPRPLRLAEESEGDCSHYAVSADWLEGAESFVAVGIVRFKGALRVLRLDWPEGFDPDDGEDGGGGEGEE